MAYTKENIDTLFSRLDGWRDQKKELSDLSKEAIETFASQYEVTKKSLRKSYREHLELLKDKEEFDLVKAEVDNIVNLINPEEV